MLANSCNEPLLTTSVIANLFFPHCVRVKWLGDSGILPFMFHQAARACFHEEIASYNTTQNDPRWPTIYRGLHPQAKDRALTRPACDTIQEATRRQVVLYDRDRREPQRTYASARPRKAVNAQAAQESTAQSKKANAPVVSSRVASEVHCGKDGLVGRRRLLPALG